MGKKSPVREAGRAKKEAGRKVRIAENGRWKQNGQEKDIVEKKCGCLEKRFWQICILCCFAL